MSPLLLWATALVCAALGLRDRRARAGRDARPAAVVPGAIRLSSRVPVPAGAALALTREGDEGRIARAGLGGVLAAGTLGRARAGGVAIALLASMVGALLAPPLALVAVPGVVLGALLPGRALAGRERARRRAAVRELPDLLDLLGICVEAGMALDPALELASGRLGGVLGDEIGRVLRDLALGTPRARAYRDLTGRVGAPEMARTVGALLQAEELGAPLSRALEGQAAALRAARRQDARERGPGHSEDPARGGDGHGARRAAACDRGAADGDGAPGGRGDRMRTGGSATAEYVGAILTVGLLMLALISLREHRPQRRPPVDPVREVAALVRPAPAPRLVPSRPAAGARRPVRPRVRRAPPPRPTVLVPGWAVGW